MSDTSFRRWSQFNLRFALFVIFIAAVFFAWYGQVELERQSLITDIESRGGRVTLRPLGWIPSFTGARVTDVTLPHAATANLDLNRLRLFPSLAKLALADFDHKTDEGRLKATMISINVDNRAGSLNKLRAEPLR